MYIGSDNSMKMSLPKLRAMILFFGTYTDNRLLGKVKLLKLFYFADFMHVKQYGAPITYDRYVHLEYGPIPSTIKNLVDNVEDDIDDSVLSDVISVRSSEDTILHRVIPSREFNEEDKDYFSESELAILEEVRRRFGDKNTKFIKDASHDEAPWKETKLLEDIPYSLAAKDTDCLVTEEEINLAIRVLG